MNTVEARRKTLYAGFIRHSLSTHAAKVHCVKKKCNGEEVAGLLMRIPELFFLLISQQDLLQAV